MRWITYRSADGAERAGLVQDERVHGLDASLLALIESSPGLSAAADRAVAAPVEVVDIADVQLCAPILRPPSVRDFLSFEEHLRNAGRALGRTKVPPVWFEQPVFYFTNPAAIRGTGAEIPISPGCAKFDYEVEVAAVVGRAGSDLTPDEAEARIALLEQRVTILENRLKAAESELHNDFDLSQFAVKPEDTAGPPAGWGVRDED